jgi:hypothetical protein
MAARWEHYRFELGCAVRNKYKRIWSKYLFASKQIKPVLFACFTSKQIGGFYMRNE